MELLKEGGWWFVQGDSILEDNTFFWFLKNTFDVIQIEDHSLKSLLILEIILMGDTDTFQNRPWCHKFQCHC